MNHIAIIDTHQTDSVCVELWGRGADGTGLPPVTAADDLAILRAHHPELQTRFLKQVHGNAYVILPCTPLDDVFWAEADAAYSNDKSTAIAIRIADCIPIMFWHRFSPVIGGIHAGWRGLEKNIVASVLDACTLPIDELEFWIGPHIAAKSYEVGADVFSHFDVSAHLAHADGAKRYLDLGIILTQQLKKAGVLEASIHRHGGDTLSADNLYSHRGGDSARNVAIIRHR